MTQRRILIIKLGALGDIVQATTAFKYIRQHYPHDHLTLLTTKSYKDFCHKLNFFDEIIIDPKYKLYHFVPLMIFLKDLQKRKFDKVFDLQYVDRTKMYAFLLDRRHTWIIPEKNNKNMHPQDRFKNQLYFLNNFDSTLSLSHIADASEHFNIKKPYVLLIPGASNAYNGKKKWPTEKYALLASHLIKQGLNCVIIGGKENLFPEIMLQAPTCTNLAGQTNFYQIIDLARHACFAIGNDTGPMLLAAAGGCPTLTLYSQFNSPLLNGARGDKNFSILEPNLENLCLETVLKKISELYPLSN